MSKSPELPPIIAPDVPAPPPAHQRGRFAVFVPGTPATQGSTRAFVVPGGKGGKGRAVVTSDNKALRPWRNVMESAFRSDLAKRGPFCPGHELPLFAGPVYVCAEFIMPRLASHPKTAQGKAPGLPRLDLDKLMRALGDALEAAGVIANDADIGQWMAIKRYAKIGEMPGVLVEVTNAGTD